MATACTEGSPGPVIRGKLVVPPAGATPPRPRVTGLVRSLLRDGRLVTVCAPVGSGRTTAVADAVRTLDRPVAWLALDGTERSAGRLLGYLEAAVAVHVPSAGRVASAALRDDLHPGEAAGLLAESLQGSRLLIVCDDVERVTADEGSVAVLDAFARYLPDGLTLVIVSSVEVPLGTPATGVLDARDLAFTGDEAAALRTTTRSVRGRPAGRAAEVGTAWTSGTDFGSASRWLDRVEASGRCPTPQAGTVVLRIAFALEQFGRVAGFFDRFGDGWLTVPGTPDHEEATVLAAWCLWHLGRIRDATELVARLPTGRPRRIAVALMGLATGEGPELPGVAAVPAGPLDGILVRCTYLRGRVSGLGEPAASDPWRAVPWVVAGMRASGRIDEAMSMYQVRRGSGRTSWLHAVDAAELMVDLGRGADAWESLRLGRTLAAESGSRVHPALGLLTEAKLALRLHQDADAADRALDAADAGGLRDYAFAHEVGRMWRGLALLLRNRNAEAQHVLEGAVASMQVGDRRLELATASAYLAEAHWRMGAEGRSDAAAQLALDVSCAQGVQHLLLAALTDVPEVATRSADAAPSRMSRWHEITGLLSTQEPLHLRARAPRLVVEEFGPPQLAVNGETVRPGLTKSVELMCFLIAVPGHSATRQQLLDAVFEGRDDAAGRTYLRQAMFRLRAALPPGLAPRQEGDVFTLPDADVAIGTARQMQDRLALASRQPDEERLATLQEAISLTDPGPYLATLTSSWVTARRLEIDDRTVDARIDAARIALRISRHALARRLLDPVLREHPHREQAWRLALSLAHATGNDDAVLAVFRRYVVAMRDQGVEPSSEVRRLIAGFRR